MSHRKAEVLRWQRAVHNPNCKNVYGESLHCSCLYTWEIRT